MHDVLERTYLHARNGEQTLASHALERINTCAYAYAERLHAMCLNDSVNAYEHTLSFWCLVVYTEQRGRPGWITIPATPWKNTTAKRTDGTNIDLDTYLGISFRRRIKPFTLSWAAGTSSPYILSSSEAHDCVRGFIKTNSK